MWLAYLDHRGSPMCQNDDDVAESSLEAFARAVSSNIGGEAAARYAEERREQEEREERARRRADEDAP